MDELVTGKFLNTHTSRNYVEKTITIGETLKFS